MIVSRRNSRKIFVAASLSFAVESHANTFFVSVTGVDVETCGSVSEPCRSIAYVTEKRLSEGDEIVVGHENNEGGEGTPGEAAHEEAGAESGSEPVSPDGVSEDVNEGEIAETRRPASVVNLLANPGFERGMSKWSDWGNNRVEYVDGNHVLRTGSGAGGAGQMLGKVKPGKTYSMSVMAKVDSEDETGALVGLTFYDAMGRRIGDEFSVSVRSTQPTLHAVQVKAPEGGAMVQVWAWKTAGPSALSVDDFSLNDELP